MSPEAVSSGIAAFDEVLHGLRWGDNVVFQVESLADYAQFTEPLLKRTASDSLHCIYIRFAPHPAVVAGRPGLDIIEVDPGQGFDQFSRTVHRIVQEHGRRVFYILDNLSTLAVEWATDELLANFFQVICPFMYEQECITYFALTRGKHAHAAIARIRDTTQILVDVYRAGGTMYIHPLKVWDRYSPRMFLPHAVEGSIWQPVFDSGEAAAVSGSSGGSPFEPALSGLAPWDIVYEKLKGRSSASVDDDQEVAALKIELGRMITGHHPLFSALVETHFDLSDLLAVRGRMIGSGRIGGKAAGMLLARKMLANAGSRGGVAFDEIMDGHDSFYIGSDVFFTFLVENDLFRLRLRLTGDSDMSEEEFEDVERRFLEGSLSSAAMEKFRELIDYYGQAPVIVRSSSLQEDSFGNAFAGKYRSEFCANQGTPEERLDAFTRALKLVYASALNPDALAYRRNRGLAESDEQMAILVQRVSGSFFRRYFFPQVAGVAMSRNLYTWSDRLDERQGVVRLVTGLGTRAVDRVGSDYPRMIALSHPELRPEDPSRITRYSQHFIDLIDLEGNRLSTVPVTEVFSDCDYPGLHLLASFEEEGYLVDPIGRFLPPGNGLPVLTFNNLVRKSGIVEVFKAVLSCLEEEYGCPVEVEFTAWVNEAGNARFNLLQCRPMFQSEGPEAITSPQGLPPESVLFRSARMINSGTVERIRYLLYIDPARYGSLGDNRLRTGLGRLVGKLNAHPDVIAGGMVMSGPGRWGSVNIALGVNVRYSDIDNACGLVEIAREEAGHVPEVSYGTHFFQDLVEAGVIYMPVWADDPGSTFNEAFLSDSPNALLQLLPDASAYAEVVKVIDIPVATGGRTGVLTADPRVSEAVFYLEG